MTGIPLAIALIGIVIFIIVLNRRHTPLISKDEPYSETSPDPFFLTSINTIDNTTSDCTTASDSTDSGCDVSGSDSD